MTLQDLIFMAAVLMFGAQACLVTKFLPCAGEVIEDIDYTIGSGSQSIDICFDQTDENTGEECDYTLNLATALDARDGTVIPFIATTSLERPVQLIIESSDEEHAGNYDVYIYAEVLQSGASGLAVSATTDTFRVKMHDCSQTIILDNQDFPLLSTSVLNPTGDSFTFNDFADTYERDNPGADCGRRSYALQLPSDDSTPDFLSFDVDNPFEIVLQSTSADDASSHPIPVELVVILDLTGASYIKPFEVMINPC